MFGVDMKMKGMLGIVPVEVDFQPKMMSMISMDRVHDLQFALERKRHNN
jgi:hypothetical protein